MAHLKNMEVTLNHMMNVFVSFLPSQILHTFFETSLNKPVRSDEYDIFVRSLDNAVKDIGDFTQPDIFFVGYRNSIALEMKIGAKSSLEQVMKYALLHIKEQELSGIQKDYNLIYLGKGDFSSLWQEKFESVEDLKSAFEAYDIPAEKSKIELTPYHNQIRQMVDKMSITYISYQDVYAFCRQHLSHVQHDRQLHKLLVGMMNELTERSLAEKTD